ncbi:MAG TPA: glycoside hydrolase family 15 protein [Thermoleophilaceae bacterium]|nr:glycoside hydrolase family 15 protein [Thermoleophilaceae bacterium]
MRTPRRHDGYAPIEDYAAVGNKRTAALVALDGSVEWMCVPRFDSPSVFGALLDPEKGGRWILQPVTPFKAVRRYLPGTNVLETTFETDSGHVRVTDAMTRTPARPIAWNELARRVECVAGRVAMRWRVEPRFDFTGEPAAIEPSDGRHLMTHGELVLALQTWDAGAPAVAGGGVQAELELRAAETALLVLSSFRDRPVAFSTREEVERRIDGTCDQWRRWSAGTRYEGPWREAVVRSGLALELMVHEPDGSMIAAATTSLPERLGGDKNWDYRYAWVRDTTFAMDSLLRIGYSDGVHAMLTWLLHTARRTHPRVHTFYGLDGRVHDSANELDWSGYRGSKPVRVGNDAGPQLQLGNFGDVIHTTWLFVRAGNRLDDASARQLADVATLLCDLWRNEDSCIWELRERRHYTQSKMSAWLALEDALRLAADGHLPADHAGRWRRERDALREFIDNECFDPARGVWTRHSKTSELDAAVLLVAGMNYVPPDDPRLHATIDAIRAELGRGPLLYRYSGMEQEEGCFLPCSFWLVEALARSGRADEAAALMDELVELSNDVGLYGEMMDPAGGAMLGNFPQALTHLSLVSAAFALGRQHAEHPERVA